MRFVNNKKNIFIIILASLAISIPFINQAYHIDDWVYLSAAVKFNKLGFAAINGKSEQMGMLFPNYYITHPFLWPFVLSIFIKIFNSVNQSVLHILSIIKLIIAGLSAYLVSKKFSKQPLVTALLFIFMPAAMIMSHSVMTDVPTVAFFLLAIGLHIEGIEKKSKILLTFSGIAATISWGFSYQALFVLGLLVFYNYQRKEKKITSFISVIIPLSIFIAWFVFTWIQFKIPHPLVSFQWVDDSDTRGLSNLFPKFLADVNSIGSAVIFPLFILFIYYLNRRFRKLLVSICVLSAVAAYILVHNYLKIEKALFAIYFSAGIFLLIRMVILLRESYKNKNKDMLFLSLWFITFFFAAAILLPLGIPRYLLPCLLPIIIIVVKDLRESFEGVKFRTAAYAGIILTLVWGILLSIADYQFSDVYKRFASDLKSKYKNEQIWFAGDAGFKLYMEEKGFHYLFVNDERPAKGNLFVIPRESWPEDMSLLIKRSKLIDQMKYSTNYPLKIQNTTAHAGFYAEIKGLLPFSISSAPLEDFRIYKVMGPEN